jgi:hypothetical protein
MKQVYNDIADLREVSVQTLRGCVLAKGVFQNCAKDIGDWSQIGGLDPDSVECSTCQVEFVSQAHIHIRDVILRGLFSGPLCEGFQKLFSRDEEVGYALLDRGDLFIGLMTKYVQRSVPLT